LWAQVCKAWTQVCPELHFVYTVDKGLQESEHSHLPALGLFL
jgi:hypothetical protein